MPTPTPPAASQPISPRRRLRAVLVRLAAALAVVLPCGPAGAALPSPYTVERLADGVYAIVREPGEISDANVLVIVNDSDVVVVDANILPSSTRQVVEEIRKLTSNPVRYVVNTHFHDDHLLGNEVYRRAYPGVEFVQHARTRELVIESIIPALERNLEVEYPAVIERYRTALATGKRSNGEPLSADLRAQLEASLPTYEQFVAEMAGIPVVPGTLVVDDELVLHRGSRTIVVRHLGRGNTPGDLVVHLPAERIVATGDLVVHPVPFAFGSVLSEWPATLRALGELDAAILVPGHGKVQRDRAYVERLVALIEATWAQVRAAVAGGADLEATRRAIDVDALRATLPGASPEALDALFVGPAVEAAFAELTAERGEPAVDP